MNSPSTNWRTESGTINSHYLKQNCVQVWKRIDRRERGRERDQIRVPIKPIVGTMNLIRSLNHSIAEINAEQTTARNSVRRAVHSCVRLD